MFTLTKAVKMNAIEVTIETTDVYDTILEVEGKLYFNKNNILISILKASNT